MSIDTIKNIVEKFEILIKNAEVFDQLGLNIDELATQIVSESGLTLPQAKPKDASQEAVTKMIIDLQRRIANLERDSSWTKPIGPVPPKTSPFWPMPTQPIPGFPPNDNGYKIGSPIHQTDWLTAIANGETARACCAHDPVEPQ